MRSISFGLLDMQSETIVTTSVDYSSSAPRNLQSEALAATDGGVYVQSLFRQKSIVVTGFIRGETQEVFDDTLDYFQSLVNLPQKALDLQHSSSTRRYIATAQNVSISNQNGLNFCTFSVEFLCSDPFGKDISATTLLNDSTTLGSYNSSFTVEGSYSALPVITITLSSVTDGTAKQVSIFNGADFSGITIIRNWTSGDDITIDSVNKEVKVNGALVEFSGSFLEFDLGSAILQYVDNFTARSVAITGEYFKRYV